MVCHHLINRDEAGLIAFCFAVCVCVVSVLLVLWVQKLRTGRVHLIGKITVPSTMNSLKKCVGVFFFSPIQILDPPVHV